MPQHTGETKDRWDVTDEEVARQEAVHQAIMAKLNELQQPLPDDGLSGSTDHDEIFYGWKKPKAKS